MSEQTLLLADPSVEARVAMAIATTAYECVFCYFAAREARVVEGSTWPSRMRWLADVQRPCSGCHKTTFWCSAGPWEPGKRVTRPVK